MNELLMKFVTFGMTKEQAKGFWMGSYRVAIVILVGAGWGWFSVFGVPEFALAGDVKAQLEQKHNEVVAKLVALELSLKDTAFLQKSQLSSSVASGIRAQAVKRCKTKNADEREQINREIDRLQDEYRTYKGETYAVPTCDYL